MTGNPAKEGLIAEINRLKKEHDAIILAHNYQLGEIQDIADFLGDSLELSRTAAATDAKMIVFCGVHFMAETAAILSPRKTVLLPRLEAGCPMADMITPEQLRQFKSEHPGAPVVTYVNSTAAVKAISDICCTSANATKVVERLNAEEVLFVPDKYLGSYVAKQTGRKVTCWDGFCPTHARILLDDVVRKKEEFPEAPVIVHPECREDVIAAADDALSTGGMLRYVSETTADTVIIGTEMGIIHRMEVENPGKRFILLSEQAVCPNMKAIQLEDVRDALHLNKHVISIEPEIRELALSAVQRMVEIG